ncbi:MAG: hypothetical protein HYT88_06260 [Candidatus Omnitrophica bacterium]|nr:hypothetical protein [Candidatus Omnitrophota bacterium]
MSYREYLFQLHTLPEVFTGTVRGFWKMVRHMELVAFHRAVARRIGISLNWADWCFQILGLAGLLVAAWRRPLRWIPLTFAALLLPIAFLYDRGILEPWRHIYQAFPWMVLSALVIAAGFNPWGSTQQEVSG